MDVICRRKKELFVFLISRWWFIVFKSIYIVHGNGVKKSEQKTNKPKLVKHNELAAFYIIKSDIFIYYFRAILSSPVHPSPARPLLVFLMFIGVC